MKSRFVYVLPSLVLALLAVGLAFYGLMSGPERSGSRPAQPQEPVPQPTPGHDYLLALNALQPGTVLAKTQFETVRSDIALADAIAAGDAPFGAPISRGLKAGELLTRSAFIDATVLQAALPPGTRAMAFSLDALSSVGGLVEPGDRVDLLGTVKGSRNGDTVTLGLSHNLEVLAVRGKVAGAEDDTSGNTDARRNQTMVLAVPDTDVAKLALAQTQTTLSVVASRPDAGALPAIKASSKDVPVAYLSDILPSVKPPATTRAGTGSSTAKQAPPPPPGTRVNIFEGSEKRSVYVR